MSTKSDVKKAAKTPLMTAVSFGGVRRIRRLLKNGADVNVFDFGGRNALFYASERGYTGILKLLLEAGANVKAVDSDSERYSLIAAASKGHEECVKILLQAGADVNVTDHKRDTALTVAARYGCDKCLKLLLQAGADVNINDHGNCLALTFAVQNGRDTCLKLLIQAGADINRYSHLSTVMYDYEYDNVRSKFERCATGLRQESYVRYTSHEKSLLMAAVFDNRIECFKLLLQAGAKVGTTTFGCVYIRHVTYGAEMKTFTSLFKLNPEIIRLAYAAGEMGEFPGEISIQEYQYTTKWTI